MPSAFVSYAHEDQEFVFVLVENLKGQGLDIRYDQIALRVGDSLIERISEEIAEGDFLIAVVSPDSLQSGWCRRELAMAMSQGINANRVKVLPVRFRGAAMPPALSDTFWADGDDDDPETLARRLTAAIRAHLEGRGDADAREAAEAQEGGGTPAHAEEAGDVAVGQIEAVARQVWDVFAAWASVWDGGGGNLRDTTDPQRRLRWALDGLSEHVRAGLPLVGRLADADRDDYFGASEPDAEAEADIREEMRSVRTQVAQGLPVARRWVVVDSLGQIPAGPRDATAYVWQLARGEEMSLVTVYITGTVEASYNEALLPEVAAAKETNGRSVVASLLSLDEPPPEVMVSTDGVRFSLPD